jgi:hypothetical protein
METYNPDVEALYPAEFYATGISWAAVIGGAFITAAFWLTLTILGVGLGLCAVSPWYGAGASAKAISAGAIIWLIITQIIASGLGGYLAGRMRTRWATVHTYEVYFRDTAHGLLVWAVAVVIAAAFLGSALSFIVGNDTKMYPTTAAWSAMPGTPQGAIPAPPGGDITAPPEGGETVLGAPGSSRVAPPMPGQPRPLTAAEVDQARKAAAKLSIWLFIALLIGAFCASVAATIGGKERDAVIVNEAYVARRNP